MLYLHIYCLPYSSLVAYMDPGQYGQTCNLTNWKILEECTSYIDMIVLPNELN